jgi:pyrroline-5-carboxylate reductase
VKEKRLKLGFVGAGNMAEAIARALLRNQLFKPEDLMASDPSEERRKLFIEELEIEACSDNGQIAENADIILLAVKPQQMDPVLGGIHDSLGDNTLVLSIAAGISTGYVESRLKTETRVVRIMPNTPMLVAKGVSVLCKGKFATDDDLDTAESIFSAGGKTFRLPEEHMNAVTAVSGSGPAYFFLFLEAVTEGALAAGIPNKIAEEITEATFCGAAKLLEESGEDAGVLRKKVTSPGGTTEAAIKSMTNDTVMERIGKAVLAAMHRAEELGK